MNVNVSNHSTVRFRRRPEGRSGIRDRSVGHFRKTYRSRFDSGYLRYQSIFGNPRTCFEGPFGEVIRATGPMAKANPFRFSTKYQDDETDLLYYDYRYYNASTGRWLSRDPIGEPGGVNLCCMVGNNPVTRFDAQGLTDWGDVIPGWWDAIWNTFD
jgi:RHS repeat-associated protein